ncbi:UbiA prenyltransferase family protein [Thermococcus waiotapuensis]|uniref:UbiA prenyltransferase family protein n=1 Tax=Thermococcus waiotapuensis TaxID=90909 RepID=A0AAE4NX91_9EURY|nr:UbiA prenyltransferase family protein [Thermococcus waiotapuensis]MDV3104370.1 UbiA prenyltransferase family protein [Thermococcus waiotapuensis]
MASVSAVIKNLRPFEGRDYVALIGLALFMNLQEAGPEKLIAAFIAGVFFVWYAFSINNCFDVDTDSLNPVKARKNPVVSGELTLKEGLVLSGLLATAGMALAFTLNREAFAVYALMTALATLYSAPPRLKARSVVDVLSHGLFFGGLPFLYGALVDGSLSRTEAWITVAMTFYSFALELRNHLEDYESDLKAGLRTTSVVIGKGKSEALVDIFSLLAIGIVLYTFTLPVAVLSSLVVARRGLDLDSKTAYRTFDAAMSAVLLLAGGGS